MPRNVKGHTQVVFTKLVTQPLPPLLHNTVHPVDSTGLYSVATYRPALSNGFTTSRPSGLGLSPAWMADNSIEWPAPPCR